MTQSYYQAGENRAARVHELFTRIARRYDFMNDLQSFGLHRLWKRRLISLAKPCATETALDVCCGTGDLALRFASAGARVTGLDFNEAMLQIARRRSAPQHSILWVQGDALRLPFPNESFDIISIAYGLRNLDDWQRGVEELVRVSKPRARLLILEFAKPQSALFRPLYFLYLRAVVPRFGKLFYGDSRAYSYILESLEHYPAATAISGHLDKLGFSVRILNLVGGAMTIHFATR